MQTKRCLELIRVSTSGQSAEDKASIPAQRTINRQTALRYGLTIVRSVELSDVSGAQVLLAPEIQEMLRMMNDPEIHGVIVREFSRLMRPENFADYAMLQTFVDSETLLYLPDGPIDFSSDAGMLTGTMRAVMGGLERRELLKKMWRIKEQKRRDGGFSQGSICLPFGVMFKDSQWSYTGDAERVKAAYRMFLSGETSYSVIARKLGLEPFNVKVYLSNPIYTGTRVVDKKRDLTPAGKYLKPDGRQAGRRKIQRLPDEVIRVKVMEPLISESQFRQAQRLIEMKRKRSWRSNENHEHRFTYNGFLLCGMCQGTMYTHFRRRDYYVCKARCGAKYQRRDRLDPIIDSLFADKLATTDYAVRIIRALRKRQPQTNVARVTSQLNALTNKRQRILDSYFESVINQSERDLRLAEIEREKATLSQLIASEQPQAELTLERLAKLFRPFVRYARLSRDSKRRLLATLTAEIVASDYAVRGLFIGIDQSRTAAGFNSTAGKQGQMGRIWLPIAA